MIIGLFHVLYLLGKLIYTRYSNRKQTERAESQDIVDTECVYTNLSCGRGGMEVPAQPPGDNSDEEVDMTSTIRFFPPAYIQRYVAVQKVLEDEKYRGKIRKVVDFGCAELGFVVYLKNTAGVEEIVCVDIDKELLEYHGKKASPLHVDYLHTRSKPLTITLAEGSVTHNDKLLEKTDAVICIELIEHLYPETLTDLPYNIFGYIKPQVAVMTTPNVEFNVLFKSTGFRHHDHKFEWTRQQFQEWAENITLRFPEYEVSMSGICEGPAGSENLGCCSQMAVFHRKFIPDDYIGLGREGLFKIVDVHEYPFHVDNRSDEQKILDDTVYYIRNYSMNSLQYSEQVPLSRLLEPLKKYLVTVETLRELLEQNGWKIANSEEGPVVLIPEPSESEHSSQDDWNDNVNLSWNDQDDIENSWDLEPGPPSHYTAEDIAGIARENWDEEPAIIVPLQNEEDQRTDNEDELEENKQDERAENKQDEWEENKQDEWAENKQDEWAENKQDKRAENKQDERAENKQDERAENKQDEWAENEKVEEKTHSVKEAEKEHEEIQQRAKKIEKEEAHETEGREIENEEKQIVTEVVNSDTEITRPFYSEEMVEIYGNCSEKSLEKEEMSEDGKAEFKVSNSSQKVCSKTDVKNSSLLNFNFKQVLNHTTDLEPQRLLETDYKSQLSNSRSEKISSREKLPRKTYRRSYNKPQESSKALLDELGSLCSMYLESSHNNSKTCFQDLSNLSFESTLTATSSMNSKFDDNLSLTADTSSMRISSFTENSITGNSSFLANSPVTEHFSLAENSSAKNSSLAGHSSLAENSSITGHSSLAENSPITGHSSLAENSSIMGHSSLAESSPITGHSSLAGNSLNKEKHVSVTKGYPSIKKPKVDESFDISTSNSSSELDKSEGIQTELKRKYKLNEDLRKEDKSLSESDLWEGLQTPESISKEDFSESNSQISLPSFNTSLSSLEKACPGEINLLYKSTPIALKGGSKTASNDKTIDDSDTAIKKVDVANLAPVHTSISAKNHITSQESSDRNNSFKQDFVQNSIITSDCSLENKNVPFMAKNSNGSEITENIESKKLVKQSDNQEIEVIRECSELEQEFLRSRSFVIEEARGFKGLDLSGITEMNLVPSEILDTPPNSSSPEVMDSGYPNSASAHDMTPEYDLPSIEQDRISDSDSPSIEEAPRPGFFELELENGDLANNNRDDEGNNMMAVEDNEDDDLQPFIHVLEDDIENENDIYVLQNGFPAWLLRILQMQEIGIAGHIPPFGEGVANLNFNEGFSSSEEEDEVEY